MPEKPPNRRRLSERPEPPPSSSTIAPADGNNANGDLFKNLVEMVPLVESLMDRRTNPSFRRKASMVYTATPSVPDTKGKQTAQLLSATKERARVEKNDSNGQAPNQDTAAADDFSTLKDDDPENMEALIVLREQLDKLHNLLSEKDEALKSAEESMKQMSTVNSTLDALKRDIAEKEFLLTSVNSHLSNSESKLEERKAAVENLEGEARTANTKVQELKLDLESMEFEKFAFMLLFEELSKIDAVAYAEDNNTSFQQIDHLPQTDNMNETELKQMEVARVAYIAALAVAREHPCSESFAAAAEARQRLEAFVL